MNNWLSIIQNCCFPPTCLLCGDAGTEGRDLCRACAQSLPLNHPACPCCGLALPFISAQACGRCQTHPPAFDRTHALYRYEEPVRHLIHALKFRARYPCARLLGQLLGESLAEHGDKPEQIIPVPLHAQRYRERGYNQSAEIARTLSRQLGIPLALNTCERVQHTQPQAELTAEQRLRNIKKAFRVIRPPAAHVAILDDVVTTGATVNELAKVLRKAGAKRIEVWACARA